MRQIYNGSNTVDNEIRDVSFISASTGFLAFNKSRIGFTTDSGRTIVERKITFENVDRNGTDANTLIPFEINGLHALSTSNIIVYGNYALIPSILLSTNGGVSYKVVFNNLYSTTFLNPGITDMVFPNGTQTGFAVDRDRVIKTTNGGQSWQTIFAPAEGELDFLIAVDNNNIFAYSAWHKPKEKIFKTTNGGANWQAVPYPKLNDFQHIPGMFFLNAQEGWMILNSDNNLFGFKTNNGGQNWELVNDPYIVPVIGFKMHFVNNKTGYAIGYPYQIYKTLDGGKIWEPLERITQFGTPELGGFKEIFVRGENQIWAGGNYEYLELSTNGGGTPLPKAFFSIDTTGQGQNGKVKVLNYSRNHYTFQWFVNNEPAGNNYHIEYTHKKENIVDSITLIVNNGLRKDTLTKYQYFNKGVVIESFSPLSAKQGDTLSINGLGLKNPVEVKLGNVEARIILSASDTLIRAIVGEGASGKVYLKTQTGWDEKSGFIFIPKPVITNFTPKEAKAGEKVIIIGSEFKNVTHISFGNTPALSFNIINENQIEAIAPSSASGSIAITAEGGKGSIPGYIAVPTIKNFFPKKATESGYVYIEGTSFDDINEISFGKKSVKSFLIESSTRIRVELGNGESGQVMVRKTSAKDSLSGFLYVTKPIISSIIPNRGNVGSTITIIGNKFENIAHNNQVFFGSSKAKILSGNSKELKVEVPPGFANSKITVVSNNLNTESKLPFSITFANGGTIRPNSMGAGHFPFSTNQSNSPNLKTLNDFDQDGRPDIVTLNDEPVQGLYLYRNKTTPGAKEISFENPFFLTETYPDQVNSCDMNGDGLPDLYFMNFSEIKIMENKSTPNTWNFGSPFKLALPIMTNYNSNLTHLDLDDDGKIDLIFLIQGYGYLQFYIYKNRSTLDSIIFDKPQEFIFYDQFAAFPTLFSDVNNDDKPDLVTSNENGDLSAILNKSKVGKFDFSEIIAISTQNNYDKKAILNDLDNDGNSDLIVNHPGRYNLQILKGNNTPINKNLFSNDSAYNTYRRGDDFGTADMDGDSLIDIVTLTERQIIFFKNLSHPGKIRLSHPVLHNESTNNWNIKITDMNLDGKPDILTHTIYGGGSIFFIPNTISAGPFIADFIPQLAVENEKVIIGGKQFQGISEVWFGSSLAKSFKIINDSTIEAIVGKGSSGAIKVRNNLEESSLEGFVYGPTWHTIKSITPTKGKINDVITLTGSRFSIDPNQNYVTFGGIKARVKGASENKLEVIVPNGAIDGHITLAINGKIAESPQPFQLIADINLGGNIPDFAPPIKLNYPMSFGPLIDLNEDGKIDLVYHNENRNFTYQLNESNIDSLKFSTPKVLNANVHGNSTYDVNGDGKQDFLTQTTSYFSYWLNSSMPNEIKFENSDFGSIYFEDKEIPTLWDIDGDASPDIVTDNDWGNYSFSVKINTSKTNRPQFGDTKSYWTLGKHSMGKIYHSDIDGDGIHDMIKSGGGAFEIIRNLSKPNNIKITAPIVLVGGPSAFEAHILDLDGDGKADIIPSNLYSNQDNCKLFFFRNISTPGNIKFDTVQVFQTREYEYFSTFNRIFTDLNGDGLPEMIQHYDAGSYSNDHSITIWKNTSVNGIISFKQESKIENRRIGNPIAVDVNGDGHRDIIAPSEGSVFVYLNSKGFIPWFNLCGKNDTTITCNIQANDFQWQKNTGNGFVDIQDDDVYSGAKSRNLKISKPGIEVKELIFRCVTSDGISPSQRFFLRESPIVTVGSDTFACRGTKVQIYGSSSGTKSWWEPVNGLSDHNIQWPLASPDSTTKYSYVSINEYNCKSQDTMVFTVNQPVNPSITISSNATEICKDLNVLFNADVKHGGNRHEILWQIGNDTRTSYSPSTSYLYLSSEVGKVSIYATLKSSHECVTQQQVLSNTIQLETITLLSPQIRYENFMLIAEKTEPGATYKWQKKFSNTFMDIQPIASSSTFRPKEDGTYRLWGSKGSCSSFSNELYIEARKPSSDPYGIYTYPNPSYNSITFESLPQNEHFETLSIYNSSMILVLPPVPIQNQNSVTIKIASLPKGYYFATFRNRDGKVHTIRFFKS